MEISHKVSKVVSGLKRAVEYFAQKRFNTNVGAPALGHMLTPKGSAENINIYISPKGEGGIGNTHLENLETNISLSFCDVTLLPTTNSSVVFGGNGTARLNDSLNCGLINSVDSEIKASSASTIVGCTGAYIYNGLFSAVFGGTTNSVEDSTGCAIIGGNANFISNGNWSVVLGGQNNRAWGATSSVVFGEYASARGATSALGQGFRFGAINAHGIRFWYGSGWIDWNTAYIAPSTVLSGIGFYVNTDGLDTVASVKLRINIYDDLGNIAHVESRVIYRYDADTSTLVILNQSNDVVYDGLTAGWVLAMAVSGGYLCIEFTGVNPRWYRIFAQADLFDNSMPERANGD